MDINTGKALTKNESLRQSIKLILLTPKGERILNRSFGSNVISYLGQPLNNIIMHLRAEVVSSLQSKDHRILVDKVNIKNNNNTSINMLIEYNGEGKINVPIT